MLELGEYLGLYTSWQMDLILKLEKKTKNVNINPIANANAI